MSSPTRANVKEMFDSISPTYDLINHILSFGLDHYWWHSVKRHMLERADIRLLDLACGTCAQITALMGKDIQEAVGIDISPEMLKVGQKKLNKKPYGHLVKLIEASALELPLDDKTVDMATMSFGIRNVTDPLACLKEIYRVVDDGGRVAILEFSLPKSKIVRAGHLFYLRRVLPVIGGLLSGKKSAYTYLNQTIETFPYGKDFCLWLEEAGFKNVRALPLTFGVATLYIGERC